MKYAAALLCALTSPATAATVDTWSGAGPNACAGRCSQSWAMSQLTPDERTDLAAAIKARPNPVLVTVNDGDVFTMSTYYIDRQPRAVRQTTIAVLDEPTDAIGWHTASGSFVKLTDCQNWTWIATRPAIGGGGGGGVVPVDEGQFDFVAVGVGLGVLLLLFDDDPKREPTLEPEPEPPVPVPLPASVWLLALGIAGLAAIKRAFTLCALEPCTECGAGPENDILGGDVCCDCGARIDL